MKVQAYSGDIYYNTIIDSSNIHEAEGLVSFLNNKTDQEIIDSLPYGDINSEDSIVVLIINIEWNLEYLDTSYAVWGYTNTYYLENIRGEYLSILKHSSIEIEKLTELIINNLKSIEKQEKSIKTTIARNKWNLL